jgi:hypothetical protein
MMVDLFGVEIMTRSLLNELHGFDDWWKIYQCLPKRKNSKPYCKSVWVSRKLYEESSHIIAYTLWRLTQDPIEYVPGPKPFLNAAGWLDWEPEAPKPKHKTALEKILEDDRLAVKPSAEIRQKIAELRK